MTPTQPEVEWVSFVDDDNTTWLFDLTFLTSGWSCTFGSTCQGTEPGDNGARGCCAHGAHVADAAEQAALVDAAARLEPEQWQNRSEIVTADDLFEHEGDELITRKIDEACVFLNSPDFAGGHGCALHIAALAHDDRPLDWKPAVCWQVPFRLEQYQDGSGTRTVAVRAWRRSDWGEGGELFGWWCTEEPPAASEGTGAWLHHQEELTKLVGEWPVATLNEYLSRNETRVELGRPEI